MTYQATVEYLMQQLPMFSNVGKDALKPSLDNITSICEALGNPQNKYPTIHIAGTNGKGSTSHMMAAVMQKAGYKTGLYTSPHLVDLRERIRINGNLISEEFVVNFVQKCLPIAQEIKPSYFELNVAMAFQAFAEQQVDIAIIETGLGGRWDSTNIVHPILSIITNIGLDHTQILGDTLAKIATEKAGIIKEKVPVVVGESHEETEQVFFLKALRQQTSIIYADSLWEVVKTGQDLEHQHLKAINKGTRDMYNITTDLMGSFQLDNIRTVLTASDLLNQQGWKLPLPLVIDSLKNVQQSTGLRGRWEILQKNPLIILDVAHNPHGLEHIERNINQYKTDEKQESTLHIVCGFVKDKDVKNALSLFPQKATYYFTQANIPRALPFEELFSIAQTLHLQGTAHRSVAAAVQAVVDTAQPQDVVLITGSFFIVGEAITVLEKQKKSNY